jgi:hypothetical protein
MKHLVFAVGLLTALACSQLNAQSSTMSVTIPFDFRLGNSNLPAGNYSIHQNGDLLSLSQVGGPLAKFILTRPATRNDAPSTGIVEFHRYGDTYFLSGVWTPASRDGRAVGKSSQETEIARRMGGSPVQTAALRSK